jgi:glutathione S-transferase
MDIKLYYSPGACSLASHIVLEELKLPHEAIRVNTAAGEQRSPEYLKINPRGRVPTLVVDGKVLLENVAIMTFLAGGFPKAGLWPEKTWDQAMALSWMTYLADTVHPGYAHLFRPERYADDPAAREAIKAKAREAYGGYLQELNGMLAGKTWAIANKFSVVDGYLVVFYRWGNRSGFPVKDLKSYTALVERVMARPAVKRTFELEGITLG